MEEKKVKTVAFLSNYFNHHQKPFSDALYEKIGDGYRFVETSVMSDERKKLGWGMDSIPEYVIPESVVKTQIKLIIEMIDDADVVIIGSAPEFLIKNRLVANKLVFRYSERPLKNGLELLRYPVRFHRWRKNNPMKSNLHLLCASAYAPADYAKFGLFKNRAYKWAYFTELKKYDDVDKLIENKKKNTILWVSRFLELKHPELSIEVAKRLRDEGYDFELNMIGIGEKQEETKSLVHSYGLDEYVNFLGAMPAADVRKHMEDSEIFLFTSDKREGWGAVLNESMNSACAVVSSHATGSTRFLLEHNKNGLIFKSESVKSLYENVKWLFDNPEKRKEISKKAYETMVNEWNAENAANRFLALAESILNGEKYPNLFESGVCSKALCLKDSWRKNG